MKTAWRAGLDEVPDLAEPIEAWRVWRVVACKDGYVLGSVVKPTLWLPGEPLAAICLRTSPFVSWLRRRRGTSRPIPDERCECGIYGAGLELLDQYLNDTLPRSSVARVVGTVSLWGRVIECERGYRGSHAYPLRLYVPLDAQPQSHHCWEDIVESLAAYDVPIDVLPASYADALPLLESAQAA